MPGIRLVRLELLLVELSPLLRHLALAALQ
jgi:hypothetical protein